MVERWSQYQTVIIETYYETKSGKTSKVHARPVPGQNYPVDWDVACSREMRKAYSVGTRFQIYAKVTDREGGKPYLYTNPAWPYEVVDDA
jgi:hypothetical protein